MYVAWCGKAQYSQRAAPVLAVACLLGGAPALLLGAGAGSRGAYICAYRAACTHGVPTGRSFVLVLLGAHATVLSISAEKVDC